MIISGSDETSWSGTVTVAMVTPPLVVCHRLSLSLQYSPPLIPPRGEVNAADAFDIGSFDEEDTKGIKVTHHCLHVCWVCTARLGSARVWYQVLDVGALTCRDVT